jgi:hypothetical protein
MLDTVVIQKLNACSDCDGSGYTKTGDYSDHLIPKACRPKTGPLWCRTQKCAFKQVFNVS